MACPTNGSGCGFVVGLWASGFWQELGSPPALSSLTVSGYAMSSNTIGRLNDLIGTCYRTSGATTAGTYDYTVIPDLTPQELAIIGASFLVSYYNGLAQSSMGAGAMVAITAGNSMPVSQIREGDSSITWANVAGIAKNFVEMSRLAKLDLNYLVNAYINNVLGASIPRSVNFLNLYYPAMCGGYGGYGA